MVLTTIQIFATIISVLVIIKFLFFLFNKKAWFNFAKKIYTTSATEWVFGVLALIVLYYLLQTMSLIEVFAAGLFMVLLMGMAFASFGNEFIKIGEKMIKRGLPASIWINFLIWIVLSAWVLYLVFM
ncbi:hypothetical protein AUJ84_02430 [Candidatus Pacearchaeota archaeon CG1_02_32_132]|nr:MAG: hypothetical protein AUJ84_02430 [Candidatus Pacearchaeota archaeon CG1_02_32_132]